MKRILAIDFGLVRTGIAITDVLQLIASPLETVETKKLKEFIHLYVQKEPVEIFVLGNPKNLDNTPSEISDDIHQLALYLEKTYPKIMVVRIDERFTSKIASHAIAFSDVSSQKRKEKGLIDKISACIILQSYLEQRQNFH
jgi:putative Holliday junction resolvase